jgi:hypothetical protein
MAKNTLLKVVVASPMALLVSECNSILEFDPVTTNRLNASQRRSAFEPRAN